MDHSHNELAELASKLFELSQTTRERWLTTDYATKRQILELACLNCQLDDATLVFEIKKPFDVLAEGLLVQSSRAGGRCPFPNDLTGIGLLHSAFAQVVELSADEFYALAKAGV